MFPHQITNNGVTVFIDGAPRQFASSHSQFQSVVDAIHSGDEDAVRLATDVRKAIEVKTLGRVTISENTIFVDGSEVKGTLVDRILAMIAMSSNVVDGYIRFLDRMHQNLSKKTIDELFDFLEACDLPITDDGCFLGYKYVRPDYTDGWTGTIDNSVGAKPRMPRNEVDDRSNVTCSQGLHVCSLKYLGDQTNRPIMVVKVAPEDVVSVPHEYNRAKMRTCGYEVVGELVNFNGGERIPSLFTDEFDPDPEPDAREAEFDADEITNDLVSIGADEDALLSFLATLDDDQFEGSLDWSVDTDPQTGDVSVQVWDMESDSVDPEIDIKINATPDEPEPASEPAASGDGGKGGGKRKLNADLVREIRTYRQAVLDKEITLTALGEKYGVHREQIARVLRGETWGHIT